MKKILFVVAIYNDIRQEWFNVKVSPRNKQFAEKHNYKYVEIKDIKQLPKFREHPSWYKYFIINELINNNRVSDGDIVTYIDADQYFVSIENDLAPKEKSMSLAIDSGNTFCYSWNSLKINDWTKTHVKNILDEDLYQRQMATYTEHPAFPNEPKTSFFQTHHEQASWYTLAGIKRHSWIPFTKLPNNGYHSAKTQDTVYTLEELNEHVELWPTTWNTTLDFDSTDRFNINKVPDKDVIIRHFAGNQYWNIDKWANE